jgi:hypothetical protein
MVVEEQSQVMVGEQREESISNGWRADANEAPTLKRETTPVVKQSAAPLHSLLSAGRYCCYVVG